MGVFAAYYLANKESDHQIFNRESGNLLSALGILLIIFSVWTFDKKTPFPSVSALLPTMGTVLIILFAIPKTWVGRALSFRPVVGVGLISYSLYLWHQPLFAFARNRSLEDPPALTYLALIGIAFSLTYLSWRYVEKPFRAKSLVSKKMVFLFSASSIFLLSSFGLLVQQKSGLFRTV